MRERHSGTGPKPVRPSSLWRSILSELRRLNSGRLDKSTLATLSRREKTTAVKKALTSHHKTPTRCC